MNQLAGEDGNLSKDVFIKHLKSSNFFLKSFDKNKDGFVSEVSENSASVVQMNELSFFEITNKG